MSIGEADTPAPGGWQDAETTRTPGTNLELGTRSGHNRASGTFYGEAGRDEIGGNVGVFRGGDGDDHVYRNKGTFYGGPGFDTVKFNEGTFIPGPQ
jgi:hypothetical protein